MNGWKLGKDYNKAICCHPASLIYMESTVCKMPGWWIRSWNQDYQEKYQQPQICRWYHVNGRKWRGTWVSWWGWKRWVKKLAWTSTFKKLTSWHLVPSLANRRGKVEAVTNLIFLGSKIAVDSDCSHKIKICLLPGRKAMTNLDSIIKSSNITLLTNVQKFKAMVFLVVMYRCES